ncbi:MAG: hypothetical protein LBS44_03365 [Deltaproteobacteria bacterium]|nr:hypothetical protein [Deltaproteobacteria bacterium]
MAEINRLSGKIRPMVPHNCETIGLRCINSPINLRFQDIIVKKNDSVFRREYKLLFITNAI